MDKTKLRMKAKSIKGKSYEEINTALQAIIGEDFQPTLAIVFIANDSERPAITKLLTKNNIRIFGASTGDNFIDEEVESGAAALMLLDINPSYFRLEIKECEIEGVKESASQIGKRAAELFTRPAFLVISGGLTIDGDEILEGFESVCGKDTTIFGGLAADALKMQRTYVFTNDTFTDKGLLALVLNGEKISLNGVAVGGWRPVGMDRVITKSEGNVVYTIDDEPALSFVKRYAGLKDVDTDNGLNFMLASNFQLQLQRQDKHPVMRTPMRANTNDGSIVFAGSLPQGSKVKLSLLPGFDVIEATQAEFVKYKNEQPEADALIVFSCAGRQITLGPYASEEINGIKNIWNAPLAGFFCYGEIGRVVSGQHEFHNMTCSLAILKEN